MPHHTSNNKAWCKLTWDRNAGFKQSEEKATQPPTNVCTIAGLGLSL